MPYLPLDFDGPWYSAIVRTITIQNQDYHMNHLFDPYDNPSNVMILNDQQLTTSPSPQWLRSLLHTVWLKIDS